MKNLIIALAFALGIGTGAFAAQQKLFVLDPINSESLEALDEGALNCAKSGGEGAILFDITLTPDGNDYDAEPIGYACVTPVN